MSYGAEEIARARSKQTLLRSKLNWRDEKMTYDVSHFEKPFKY
jgi:hypothetical protein